MIKFSILLLALLACFDGQAKIKKSKKAKKAEVVKVDTCSVDTFSYAMGMANTQGLKNYVTSRMNVNAAYMGNFVEGFHADLSAEERMKILAFVAGLQIRQQVEEQVIPSLNKSITDNDTTEVINKKLFLEAFGKALSGEKTDFSMVKAEEIAKKQMQYYTDANMERKYGENRRAGEDFLKANAKKPGVKTLDCGVQYKVLTKGEGEIPTATSKVKVNYEGRLVDGTIFDSSYERKSPTTFGCNQVIKGWTEALTHMPVGSKWEIYIPQELAYGAREAGKIKPLSALIFIVELLEIEK